MKRRRFSIPSTSALLAFESAARQRSFSRAAAELNTSQSAISRHVAALEGRLGARLFERHKKGVELTEAGDHFYRAVVSGLENIQSAALAIARPRPGDELTIACTHEISHLFLMPRFEALQKAIGEETRLRVMTYEYDTLEATPEPRVDVVLTYQASGVAPQDRVVAFSEAVAPLCSPAYAEAHRAILAGAVRAWAALTFLRLTRRNRGWATWEDWFAHTGSPERAPRYVGFENYVYLLEAAAAGGGLALGWRNLIERYLAAGTLVAAGAYVEFDRPFFATLTAQGRNRPAARQCLSLLEEPPARAAARPLR